VNRVVACTYRRERRRERYKPYAVTATQDKTAHVRMPRSVRARSGAWMARRARVKIVALLCLTQGCARASVSLELLRCSDGWSHARVCVRVCVCACVRVVCVCACVGDQKDGGAVPLSCPAEMQF
jgi:hypothetical protein